jgi:hypothetical protein
MFQSFSIGDNRLVILVNQESLLCSVEDSALSSTLEGSQAEYDFVNKDEEDAFNDYMYQQAMDNGGYPE